MGYEINLPDFEDMYATIDKIKELTLRKLKAELLIKGAINKVVRKVTTDATYFVNGKIPSMSFIEKTYIFSGLDKEILPVREEYAELSSSLEHLKLKFSLDTSMIDVWRTMEANKRRTVE